MKHVFDYFRGLIADANLATNCPMRHRQSPAPGLLHGLDHPTYLRRGVVIAGLAGAPTSGASLRRSAGHR